MPKLALLAWLPIVIQDFDTEFFSENMMVSGFKGTIGSDQA